MADRQKLRRADFSRQLIHAREEQGQRIARELHDDLSQRLSLLAANLDRLQQDVQAQCPPQCGAAIRKRLQALWQNTTDILLDVESISRELHSSIVEQVGLKSAVRILCKDIARRTGTEIHLIADAELPKDLSKDVGLCVYRLVQEALRNVIQHSGARHAQVEIRARADALAIIVSDPGRGFDPERGKHKGLGLVSMHERVRLVGGNLSIQSKLLRGTTVIARIPLPASSRPRLARGAD